MESYLAVHLGKHLLQFALVVHWTACIFLYIGYTQLARNAAPHDPSLRPFRAKSAAISSCLLS